MPLLSVRDLTHTYPNGFQALKGISFDVEAGEFLVVIGLSGSGKSTLLRCLNRLIEPTGGSITFDGQDVTHIANDALRKHRGQIGMIFQHFNLIPRHSVLNNVLYGALGSTGTVAAMLGRFSDELRTRALEALRVVGIAEKSTVRADALSGGQQQRVAIARALMQQPRMLLADEPVASLDPSTSHSVMTYLERINKDMGTTVICNLHFLSLVRQYATRVIALKDGIMVFNGSPHDITEEWFTTIYGEDAVEVEIR
ncbi:MAG: phosphonate ABC transporter ATP-binding protein [Ignavibacteria bacterium]|nr:phosphonate ABC transporter ATP-binding protein [Ignavibacteria bacterium]MBP7093973.1 phosphonate ABC transporter ATP-binding protein [Candidatus Kapabacteria bacterium]MBK6418340.1 phosphonate ABC transporter ATP-binding protein [Ignavibacteria bacterium]MBK6761118.1 phosphonate ABC transporter ATP-binding protein [Ignavibacteria bacterium]MBK7185827.1 phosphonate ABC transporter ATP-binding protein [Ignavibacteria bacterium]